MDVNQKKQDKNVRKKGYSISKRLKRKLSIDTEAYQKVDLSKLFINSSIFQIHFPPIQIKHMHLNLLFLLEALKTLDLLDTC